MFIITCVLFDDANAGYSSHLHTGSSNCWYKWCFIMPSYHSTEASWQKKWYSDAVSIFFRVYCRVKYRAASLDCTSDAWCFLFPEVNVKSLSIKYCLRKRNLHTAATSDTCQVGLNGNAHIWVWIMSQWEYNNKYWKTLFAYNQTYMQK